ncbi:hypothetical protein [Actinomadura geliboluensis]|uniref:hypothetical protein n=1 Tax=Actinomadura geliboluensis TaxID=882440 RepID=UPI0036A2799A
MAERAKMAVLGTQIMDLPHSLELERQMLGPPIFEGPLEDSTESAQIGYSVTDSRFRSVRFALPVFDGFDYEVQVAPGGLAVAWRLSRALSSVAPPLKNLSSLHTWSHVKPEVMPFLENVEMIEEFGYWELLQGVLAVDQVPRRRIGLRFVAELLQEVWIIGSG